MRSNTQLTSLARSPHDIQMPIQSSAIPGSPAGVDEYEAEDFDGKRAVRETRRGRIQSNAMDDVGATMQHRRKVAARERATKCAIKNTQP